LIGDGDGGSDGNDNMYNRSMEPVLVLLSNLYSDNDAISVSDSRPSSCPAYTVY